LKRPVSILAALVLLAAVAAHAVEPPPAYTGVGGVTAWVGKAGTVELVALIGKAQVGLGLGHRFPALKLTMGKATVGAALGVGVLLPFGASTCTTNCHTGLSAARVVVFVTLPIGGA
jgi:hypothetical protein